MTSAQRNEQRVKIEDAAVRQNTGLCDPGKKEDGAQTPRQNPSKSASLLAQGDQCVK